MSMRNKVRRAHRFSLDRVARFPLVGMRFVPQVDLPDAVSEAIPELEFDQTANLRAEGGHERLLHNAGVDAEPILELEFGQTLGW